MSDFPSLPCSQYTGFEACRMQTSFFYSCMVLHRLLLCMSSQKLETHWLHTCLSFWGKEFKLSSTLCPWIHICESGSFKNLRNIWWQWTVLEEKEERGHLPLLGKENLRNSILVHWLKMIVPAILSSHVWSPLDSSKSFAIHNWSGENPPEKSLNKRQRNETPLMLSCQEDVGETLSHSV